MRELRKGLRVGAAGLAVVVTALLCGSLRAHAATSAEVTELLHSSGKIVWTYHGSRAVVSWRKGTGTVDIRGSIFCEVRDPAEEPLCAAFPYSDSITFLYW